MNLQSIFPARPALAALCGAVIAAALLSSPARADEWNKKTILTVNQPIQVTDTVLQPGQYVLKLLDSQSERHVVQIFNRYQTHIIDTIIAVPTMRLEPTGRTQFTFWETPPGMNRALRDWYYPGDNYGQEFPYPKHLQQVAMLTPAPAAEPAPAPAPPPEPEATPAPTPEPPVADNQPQEQEQTEVAQNTAPPETPAQTAPEQPAPTQLPKTGTFYPAIGALGALLLCVGGLLRIKRHA